MERELAIVTRGIGLGAAGGAVAGFLTCVALFGAEGPGVGVVFGAPLGAVVGLVNGIVCAYALVLADDWIGPQRWRAEAVGCAASLGLWSALWSLTVGSGWGLILAVGAAISLAATALLTPAVARPAFRPSRIVLLLRRPTTEL